MATTTRATRTRDRVDFGFRQTAHGEKQHGQTPAGLFLETILANTREDGSLPRVQVIKRDARGNLVTGDPCRTREEILMKTISCIDGHLTAIDADDYSVRLIVLDPDAGRHTAWLEMFHTGTDTTDHPEMGRD